MFVLTMWSYKFVLIVAVISAASAKSISQEDDIVRNVARNRDTTFYYYNTVGAGVPVAPGGPPDGFEPTLPIIILIHDHRGHYQDAFSTSVRLAYFGNLDCNLFVMDWSFLAKDSYADVVRNLDIAADSLVTFLNDIGMGGTLFPNVRLIGFGIGAHLAGNAGLRIGNGIIGEIIGLDPSGKSFSGTNSRRLRSNNADFVEVIHSDASSFGSGIGMVIGDADFFVNGGSNQPGCVSSSCNHDYSYIVYISSLTFNHYGYSCNSMTQVSFNSCRGRTMVLGGLEKTKIYGYYYRVNTSRNLPRSTKITYE